MDCLLLAQDQVELDVGAVGHGVSFSMVVGSLQVSTAEAAGPRDQPSASAAVA
jgi:hypothetical protein